MNCRALVRVSACVCLASLAAGCTGPARQTVGHPTVQAGDSAPLKQNDIVHLSAEDTVSVSVEVEPIPPPAPIFGQIGHDGTLGIWGGQHVKIVGLTTEEASSRIRLALVTNYFGLIFHNVSVAKVQQVEAPK